MTMYTPDVRAIAEEFRRESAEDYVGFWQIARSLKVGQLSDEAVAELIVQVAAHLLADGTICIGQFNNGAFEPWTGDVTAQLEQLHNELRQLGRVPDIGEIGWFVAR